MFWYRCAPAITRGQRRGSGGRERGSPACAPAQVMVRSHMPDAIGIEESLVLLYLPSWGHGSQRTTFSGPSSLNCDWCRAEFECMVEEPLRALDDRAGWGRMSIHFVHRKAQVAPSGMWGECDALHSKC